MLRLIGVGDNTVDTYIQERIRYPGGNAVNVAVHAKRYGADAAYLGALGDDECGDLILDSLRLEGVNISYCKRISQVSNAFAEVKIVDGERIFGDYSSGAAELLKLTKEDFQYINRFDLVHTSIYSFLENQMDDLQNASKFLSIDCSSEINEMDVIQRSLPFVDLAIFSLADFPEIEVLDFARAMHQAGPKIVLVTRGSQGSWVFDGVDLYHQEVIEIDVVDTMGAGDAYIAAFALEYRLGTDINAAMRKAAHYAASVCEFEGAFGYGKKY